MIGSIIHGNVLVVNHEILTPQCANFSSIIQENHELIEVTLAALAKNAKSELTRTKPACVVVMRLGSCDEVLEVIAPHRIHPVTADIHMIARAYRCYWTTLEILGFVPEVCCLQTNAAIAAGAYLSVR